MKKWETSEDFEKDLFEYSQMEYPGKIFESAPPKSIAEYRARTSKNVGLFDEKMESKEIFISGRGKHTPGVIIRPGMPVTSTPEEDMDIRRKIREVSGLGYGNEISERMYGQKETSSSEDEDSDPKLSFPELKLQSSKKSPKLSKKKTNISPDKLVKDVNDNSPKK